MIWLNFLHFYQPANIEDYKIREALDKSYWRLVRLMEEHSNLKMTWNISGCLLERLADNNEKSFIARVKALVSRGQIELTGSAAYHGFLPLLPEDEVISQIKINELILRKHFGAHFKKAGFFLPEMAYSPVLAKIVKKLGYQWLILDELSSGENLINKTKANFNLNQVYSDRASGLKVVFRSRDISNAYPPDRILAKLILKEDKLAEVLISATDAELYGLRHEDPTGEIEKVAKHDELKTVTISEFVKNFKSRLIPLDIYASSWETSKKELLNQEPYSLWFHDKNKIQVYLWKLAYLSLELNKDYKKDKNYLWYRWHLVRGLSSCTFWWASARDFSKSFGPYTWSPDDIERGLEDLIRSVRSLSDIRTKKKKLEAEYYYLHIKELIWSDHWNKHWQKMI